MPIVVDDRRRKAEIAEVATLIIDRLGLHGLTIRAIAREAGCSTSFVTGFFADKRAMLLHVLGAAAGRAKARIDTVLATDPLDVRGCIEAYLPLDAGRRRDWKIYFAFWDMAAADTAFADEQKRWQDVARAHFAAILARRRDRQPNADDIHHADRLLALVMGISTQAAFDAATWSEAAMTRFIRKEIDQILTL